MFSARTVEVGGRMVSRIEKLCIEKGLRMTDQRRLIAQVISDSNDHPDVEEVHARANTLDANISIPTVYRTMKIFEENDIIEKHDFGDGRARYEEVTEEHHDHLIDIKTGKVIEFVNEEIEKLQEKVAKELGYKIVDHRLEIYGVPLKNKE